MQKNANETAKETKNMFLQSAKELKALFLSWVEDFFIG